MRPLWQTLTKASWIWMNTKIKTIKPTQKHLRRKIPIDDVGNFVTVGNLTKKDLQILICWLADEIEQLKRGEYGFED